MDVVLYKADLSFLFEEPSVWLTLVQVLLAAIPLTIGLSAFAMWRVGERQGLWLMAWVVGYLVWLYWPIPFEEALILPARVVSVILWGWLVGEWFKRLHWHEPLLLTTNALTAAALLTLLITLSVAGVRDVMGWDLPSSTDQETLNPPKN